MKSRKENLTEAVILAGYQYAKDFFESIQECDEFERLPDGRPDPNYLSIYDAPSEILGWCPEDVIMLDPALFPGKYNREEMWDLMNEYLGDEQDYLFIEGEKKYICEIYGDNWEN